MRMLPDSKFASLIHSTVDPFATLFHDSSRFIDRLINNWRSNWSIRVNISRTVTTHISLLFCTPFFFFFRTVALFEHHRVVFTRDVTSCKGRNFFRNFLLCSFIRADRRLYPNKQCDGEGRKVVRNPFVTSTRGSFATHLWPLWSR